MWVIAYDLDVKGMRDNGGYTKSHITQFYNYIRKCLADNNFAKMKQLNIYTSEKPNSLTDAINVCIALKAVPDSDKFIKRLHLFRIEDFNDLLPSVAGRESGEEIDEVEQEISELPDDPPEVAMRERGILNRPIEHRERPIPLSYAV
jgi:virulence-associated protein VapD